LSCRENFLSVEDLPKMIMRRTRNRKNKNLK
jgi:hypothetical protein